MLLIITGYHRRPYMKTLVYSFVNTNNNTTKVHEFREVGAARLASDTWKQKKKKKIEILWKF